MEKEDKRSPETPNKQTLRDAIRFLDCISGMLGFVEYALTYLKQRDNAHFNQQAGLEELSFIHEKLKSLQKRVRSAVEELDFQTYGIHMGRRHAMLLSIISRLLRQMSPFEGKRKSTFFDIMYAFNLTSCTVLLTCVVSACSFPVF